jgi:uncharacterized protein YkwD
MAGKRAYRPTALDGLEARVALSYLGARDLILRSVHIDGLAHVVRPHHVGRAHHGGAPSGGASHLRKAHRDPHPHGLQAVLHPPATTPPAPHAPITSAPIANAPVATPPVVVPPTSGTLSAQEQAIVDLTNQQRQQAGLPPLQVNAKLVEAAHLQAEAMAQLGQMAHVLPGAALPTPESRFLYVGYNYSWLGENIAFNYPDANAVVTGWMNSPEHRANLLNPHFTEIGVGVAFDAKGQPYDCQDFGQPL